MPLVDSAATLAKASQTGAKDDRKERCYCRGQQCDLRSRQIYAIDLFENVTESDPHLSGCLGIIARHDDAGFSLDHRRRSNFLICWVAGAREQAENCNCN
jgi:hypothetical protein